MKFRVLAALAGVLLLPFALQSAPRPVERPFLWQLELSPPSYLYGTVHVPDERVLALPDAVRSALRRTDVLYTEVPMDRATRRRAERAALLGAGETLQTVLPGPLYDRTAKYVRSKGIPIQLNPASSTMARFSSWLQAAALGAP